MGLRWGRGALAAASVLLGGGAVAVFAGWLVTGGPTLPVVLPLAALSFVCAVWARRFGRRYAAATGAVPPGWDGVDLEVQTAGLRVLATWATIGAVVWALVAAAAVAGGLAVLGSSGSDPDAEVTAGGILVVAAVALAGLVFSLVAAAGWRRRHRAVTETGWRAGAATVRAGGSGLPTVTVAVENAADVRTQASTSVRGAAHMADFPGTAVQVAGRGRWMVVLFPRGLFRNIPYAVPVRSLEQR
ncbi:hypothetical protein M8542_35645 [Amycolatopsis sp. OK19-0408]|uniref:Uncharacterized protein n=1 Tax=Amycolatopsis iheyensis TaxID=2945988 RepID=A0A9X2NG35_9PSEU|nr:hypothetical protein [Amycolatopsis iheyensis]MCR6488176.1 hypothetical protein [Amycolatopsis iheyensis]